MYRVIVTKTIGGYDSPVPVVKCFCFEQAKTEYRNALEYTKKQFSSDKMPVESGSAYIILTADYIGNLCNAIVKKLYNSDELFVFESNENIDNCTIEDLGISYELEEMFKKESLGYIE